jgi:hypothetical protein
MLINAMGYLRLLPAARDGVPAVASIDETGTESNPAALRLSLPRIPRSPQSVYNGAAFTFFRSIP